MEQREERAKTRTEERQTEHREREGRRTNKDHRKKTIKRQEVIIMLQAITSRYQDHQHY